MRQRAVGVVMRNMREKGDLHWTEGLRLEMGSKPFRRGLAFQLLAGLQEGVLWGCSVVSRGGGCPACLQEAHVVVLDLPSCCLPARTFTDPQAPPQHLVQPSPQQPGSGSSA